MGKQGNLRNTIQLPAIALIVVGVIGIGLQLFSLVAGPAVQGGAFEWLEEYARDQPGFDPDLWKEFGEALGGNTLFSSLWSVGLIAVSGLVVFAGFRMRQARAWALAVAASIIAMLPCCGPCCCIGLPIGIWSLVVLMKPEVRKLFEGKAPMSDAIVEEEQDWGGGS